MTQADVRFAVAEDGDAEALAAFYRAVWDPAATADGVRRGRAAAARRNAVDPGQPPPEFLARHGDRIVGYLGSIAGRFWNGERELPGYWLKGLMVLPEYRGGPIGFAVLREATRRLPRTIGMVVTSAARRLFTAVGFTDVGAIPNFVRVLRGGRVAARLDLEALELSSISSGARKVVRLAQRTGLASVGGAAIGVLFRARAAAARVGTGAFRVGPSGFPPAEELDRMWADARASIRAGAVRDGAEFHDRYAAAEGSGPYRAVTARRGDRLAGLAVVRTPRLDGDPRLAGIGLASLSDLWFPPSDVAAGLTTLGAAEAEARRLGADAILCSCGHADLVPLLAKQGYLRLGGNVHLMVRDAEQSGLTSVPMTAWWTMRGDARSDEVF